MRSHKPSVFHLMDRLGYEIFKVESASAVCPPDICLGARTRRPACSTGSRATGGRPAFTPGSAPCAAPQPAFYFQHSLMPHEPGSTCRPATRAGPQARSRSQP